jgi:hypothetical protein
MRQRLLAAAQVMAWQMQQHAAAAPSAVRAASQLSMPVTLDQQLLQLMRQQPHQ